MTESQLLLAKQVALIEPLRDLAAHETDTTFLAPEYRYKGWVWILRQKSLLYTAFLAP
jgi:hypothetical protein